MVFDLLKRLVAPAAEPLAGADARLAMAALMVLAVAWMIHPRPPRPVAAPG